MKLTEFRDKFPDYSDLSDDDVVAQFEIEVGESPDLVTPALYDIEETLEKLCATVQAIVIPDKSADVLLLLKQIKNGLGSLETAIKSIDVSVTVPPPVVNIPPQVVKAAEIVFPEPLKEWTFDVKRDRNGYIQSVTARA